MTGLQLALLVCCRIAAGEPVTLAPLGDSRTAIISYDAGGLNRSTQCHLNWANALNGQAFPYTGNFGISGAVSDRILAANLAPALATHPTHLVILMGVNDVKDPAFNADHTMANIVTAAEAALAQGTIPILCTDPGSEHYVPAQVAFINAVNARIQAYCAANPRAILFDLAALMSMQRTPRIVFQPGWVYDGIHLQTLGAYQVGIAFAELMRSRVGAAMRQPVLGNLLVNAAFAGQGGTLGAGTSGSLPDSFIGSRDNAACTVVFSLNQRADALPELVVAVANAEAKALAGMRVAQALPLGGVRSGDAFQAGVEVDIDPGSVNLGDVRAEVSLVFADGSFATAYDFETSMARTGKPVRDTISSLPVTTVLSLTMRSAELRIPADKVPTAIAFRLGARIAGEGQATVRFRQPWCRKSGAAP